MTIPRQRQPAGTFDSTGERLGMPTYPWNGAPTGLATRRQLRAAGLAPGGQEPVARLLRRSRGRLFAYLYDVSRAVPKRTATAAQLAAARKATAFRHFCSDCGQAQPYIPPKRTGRRCLDCAGM